MSEEDLRASISRMMRGLNHDLKNPLGAADGYVDLLLQGFRGDITPEQRQTLERVRTLIASGVDILEDVVTFARASIGELKVHPSPTELRAVVRTTMERHAARAADADIALDFQGPDEPVRIETDGTVVQNVVRRLIENALDNAPDGGRVGVAVARDGTGAQVRVTDSGPPIPEVDRDRVFLAFERGAAPARTRESAGIGIGLALARALTDRLGGTLTADDGKTFVLKLP
ncbi:MAG TPA: HAMP domain-containing sensor histidine kinase [Thermoanaerobaculia bacterium]